MARIIHFLRRCADALAFDNVGNLGEFQRRLAADGTRRARANPTRTAQDRSPASGSSAGGER